MGLVFFSLTENSLEFFLNSKKFAIIEKIGEDILFRQKEEALEESKVKEKEKLEKEKKGEDKDESP